MSSTMQAGTEPQDAFDKSTIIEPHLVVFHDDKIEQMFICSENDVILDIAHDSATLVDGIIHLMAAYYVFHVEYPKICRNSFLFLQDIARNTISKTSAIFHIYYQQWSVLKRTMTMIIVIIMLDYVDDNNLSNFF